MVKHADSCLKIVDKFGAAATEKVKNNPYLLFTINGFGFKTVDEIAQKTHTPPNDLLRIMGALKFVLTEAQNNGHLCMVQEELRSSAYSMLNEGFDIEAVSMDEVICVIKQMALDGTLKSDNGYAYLAYNYDNESFAAGCVRALLCNRVKPVNVNKPISSLAYCPPGRTWHFKKSQITDEPGISSYLFAKAIKELESLNFISITVSQYQISIMNIYDSFEKEGHASPENEDTEQSNSYHYLSYQSCLNSHTEENADGELRKEMSGDEIRELAEQEISTDTFILPAITAILLRKADWLMHGSAIV